MCKIVRPSDRAGIGASVASGERNGACSVLDVMSVEHKGQKRKLLLTEDETFHKLSRSNLENIVKPERCV